MFERSYLQHFINRIEEPRKFIQVLMGPRQVGKTTLVNQLVTKMAIPYLFTSADGVAAANDAWLVQQWDTAQALMPKNESTEFLLIVDEIQKITNWSETVKLLWDKDTREGTNLKVILLGSSRLLLQQGLTESLAGRFETTYMGHWSFEEMQQAFGWDVDRYVWFGGYPGAAALVNDEERWKRYITDSLIETSISKDILMLTRVDKPALMKKLFELGCLYSGQVLSYTKIMGQLLDAGNTTTLAHYLQLLNTAGLLCGLEKFDHKVIRKRSSSPKFQIHNTALISAQKAEQFSVAHSQPVLWERIVESAIGAHLVNAAYSDGFGLYYWREGNYEMDFVLEHGGKVIGIEVKSGTTMPKSSASEFRKRVAPDKILLVGQGGIPWQEFLTIEPKLLF
ncbi:ATP-binding protein [Olivibacter sitiensis]|uniref:ATP-binding protein n=1 Tax=Olivibacter sitiensis TaxID=376470 RepID=UPI00042A05B1|nr:ATP-binding protein [Olivibacter sitiensis]